MEALRERVNPFVSMPMDEYQAAEGISKSKLDLIHRSPAHYRQELLHPSEPTPAMIWGSAFHAFVLEPDTFFDHYAVLPEGIDRRTKEGKEIWADWCESNIGKEPVSQPTLEELEAMRDSIYSHSRAKEALSGGLPEQAMFWEAMSVNCKGRPDYIKSNGLIIDVKTTLDARSDAFSKSCWNYRYHVQAAFYTDGYKALTGEEPVFLFVAIEKSPPYAVAVYHANPELVEQGRREYQQDLITYAKCLETDTWPAYPEEIVSIVLPRWTREEM